jgi:hypothetical protein
MSSYEFSEWMAFARIQPFGEQRMDARFAMLASLMANLWTNDKKRWTPEDFMPDFEKAIESEEDVPTVTVVDKVKSYFGMLVGASKQNAESGKQAPPLPLPK